jgi:Fe2+ transport system protein FeoA
MISPSGDPTAYRIRGALIALRKEQADLIYIAPNSEPNSAPIHKMEAIV